MQQALIRAGATVLGYIFSRILSSASSASPLLLAAVTKTGMYAKARTFFGSLQCQGDATTVSAGALAFMMTNSAKARDLKEELPGQGPDNSLFLSCARALCVMMKHVRVDCR